MKAHLSLCNLVEATGLSASHIRRLSRKPKGDPERIPGAFSYKSRKHIKYMDGGPLQDWIRKTRKWVLRRAVRRGSYAPAAALAQRWGWVLVTMTDQATEQYVDLNEPVPAWLLKRAYRKRWNDFTSNERWPELLKGHTGARTYITFDDQQNPIELLKLSEALLAASINGHDIFNRDTVRRYQLGGVGWIGSHR